MFILRRRLLATVDNFERRNNIRQILSANNIEYSITSKDMNKRCATEQSVLATLKSKIIYNIYVDKDDLEYAKYLILSKTR